MKYRIEFEATMEQCPASVPPMNSLYCCAARIKTVCPGLGEPGCPAVAVETCRFEIILNSPFVKTGCGHEISGEYLWHRLCPKCKKEIEVVG